MWVDLCLCVTNCPFYVLQLQYFGSFTLELALSNWTYAKSPKWFTQIIWCTETKTYTHTIYRCCYFNKLITHNFVRLVFMFCRTLDSFSDVFCGRFWNIYDIDFKVRILTSNVFVNMYKSTNNVHDGSSSLS